MRRAATPDRALRALRRIPGVAFVSVSTIVARLHGGPDLEGVFASPSRSSPPPVGRSLRMRVAPSARSFGCMTRHLVFVAVLAACVVAVTAGPAFASLADEVAAGRQVAQELRGGKAVCSRLATDDFEHLGEYAMERMLGSRSAHAAMNERMASMLGDANSERMHELMGRRYAGCDAAAAGGAMMGTGMMAGPGWAAMMRSHDFAWMRTGAWRHMSRADWQRTGASWMGPGMMSRSDHGWSNDAAVVALVLGALSVSVLALYTVLLRPWRRRHPRGPAAI